MEESVIDEKGRVVIPKRLRERAGLREGVTKIAENIEELEKLPPSYEDPPLEPD